MAIGHPDFSADGWEDLERKVLLSITFVAPDSDEQAMSTIQSGFKVAVRELPGHMDPASYSTWLRSLDRFVCILDIRAVVSGTS
jgi:hypothetical protein